MWKNVKTRDYLFDRNISSTIIPTSRLCRETQCLQRYCNLSSTGTKNHPNLKPRKMRIFQCGGGRNNRFYGWPYWIVDAHMVFWRLTSGSVWLHSVAKDVSSYYINIPRSNLNSYHSRISDITKTNNLLNESHFLNYIPECILSDYIHPNHNQICASHFLL